MHSLRAFYPGQQGFLRLQSAVSAHFERHHGARPRPSPDEFWCLAGPDGDPPGHACIGLSWGGTVPLFSEHYLDLSLPASRGIAASQLVEIGQFASFSAGGGTYLMSCVLRLLAANRAGCAVLTATVQVRHLLTRLGVEFDDLGPARRERVRDKDVEWGTYYRSQPRVVVIDIGHGLTGLTNLAWTAPTVTREERRRHAQNQT